MVLYETTFASVPMIRLSQRLVTATTGVSVLASLFVCDADAQRGNVVRTRRGDTVVVSTTGNGAWGPPHDAVEFMRVSGDTKETTFGQAYLLSATPDGGVLVVDTKSLDGLIVRQFDANGKFVRNIGRKGEGPGEYIRNNLSLFVRPDGTILLRDSDKSVSRFGKDGKLLSSFSLFHTNGNTNEILGATDGSIWVRAPFINSPAGPTGGAGLQRPLVQYDTAGKILDSIVQPAWWVPPSTDPMVGRQWWSILSDGRLVFSRTDKIGFLIVDRTGKAPPLMVEGPSELVPYLKEERDELQGARDFSRDACPNPRVTPAPRVIVPEMKLPARGPAWPDVDGRIWISKSTTAKKIPPKVVASCFNQTVGSKSFSATYEEPPAYVAFQTDGAMLGEVRFPLRARVTFVGNFAWALVPDEDDVPTLIKYRLH